jgi:hypothetical protein
MGNFCNVYIKSGWNDFDLETKLFIPTVEPNTRRVAVMSILGLMVHEEIRQLKTMMMMMINFATIFIF